MLIWPFLWVCTEKSELSGITSYEAPIPPWGLYPHDLIWPPIASPKPHFPSTITLEVRVSTNKFEGTQTFTHNTWKYHSLLLDPRFPSLPCNGNGHAVQHWPKGHNGSLLGALWERFPTKYKPLYLPTLFQPWTVTWGAWWMVLLQQASCDHELSQETKSPCAKTAESRKWKHQHPWLYYLRHCSRRPSFFQTAYDV